MLTSKEYFTALTFVNTYTTYLAAETGFLFIVKSCEVLNVSVGATLHSNWAEIGGLSGRKKHSRQNMRAV